MILLHFDFKLKGLNLKRGKENIIPFSSQFVDKRGSELKNSEPLLKFPLNFRLKLRDWGSTSPLC